MHPRALTSLIIATSLLAACSPPPTSIGPSLAAFIEVKSCSRSPSLKCIIKNRTDQKIDLLENNVEAVVYDGDIKKFNELLTGTLDPRGATEVLISSVGPMDSVSRVVLQQR